MSVRGTTSLHKILWRLGALLQGWGCVLSCSFAPERACTKPRRCVLIQAADCTSRAVCRVERYCQQHGHVYAIVCSRARQMQIVKHCLHPLSCKNLGLSWVPCCFCVYLCDSAQHLRSVYSPCSVLSKEMVAFHAVPFCASCQVWYSMISVLANVPSWFSCVFMNFHADLDSLTEVLVYPS